MTYQQVQIYRAKLIGSQLNELQWADVKPVVVVAENIEHAGKIIAAVHDGWTIDELEPLCFAIAEVK